MLLTRFYTVKSISVIPVTVLLLSLDLFAQTMAVRPSSTASVFPNGVSVPADYPQVKISLKNKPDSGLIFINNWGGTPYIAILDNSGWPVFYRRMQANARDFKLQMNGHLSYRLSEPYHRFYEMDSGYTVMKEIAAINNLGTDEHELQILPNGNMLLIALEYKTVDMSKLIAGGKTAATIIGNHIQEIAPNGTTVFEWKCWDYYSITDAVHENLTAQTIDYLHMNAISLDRDSNIVVSVRHLSELTKIDRKTGKVLWRLGGPHNHFRWINDPDSGFSYQHDVRVLPNGNITVFDNGNFHSPAHSRAAEYRIDTVAWTATLVWQYRHSPDRYSGWMGNVQRLPNGNTLINWADGSLPKLTEVNPSGIKEMEMGFVEFAHCYRVFRFQWKGKPKTPTLIIEPGPEKITLLMNYFDQTPSHQYTIYCDTVPSPTRVIDSVEYSAADVTGLKNGKKYYFRITVKRSDGSESPFSNEESLVINSPAPGDNMVVNGDFSAELDHWFYFVNPPAVSTPYFTASGELMVQIGNGGSQVWHVQLGQDNLPLIYGQKYRFEFDARGQLTRYLDIKVEKGSSPYTNYGKTGVVGLTTTPNHFSFDFTMENPSDVNARITFNCGLSDIDVYVDNVSLKQIVPQGIKPNDAEIPEAVLLQQNYPNPFNPETMISYAVPNDTQVRLIVSDLLGRRLTTLVEGFKSKGTYDVPFSLNRYPTPSGIYFYTLIAGSRSLTKRMVVLQ